MVGYDFAGGGIYTTPGFDFYINFATYYVVPYVLWLLLIHYLYSRLIKGKFKFDMKIFVIILLCYHNKFGSMIESFELYILLLLMFFLINNRWRLV